MTTSEQVNEIAAALAKAHAQVSGDFDVRCQITERKAG